MSLTGVSTIVLYCADTEASRRWYESLGFQYAHGHDGMHWLAAGPTQIMLHPVDSARPNNGTPSIDVGTTDLNGLFAAAKSAGHRPFDHQQPEVELSSPVVQPWGDRTFDLVDPDGYHWSFVQK